MVRSLPVPLDEAATDALRRLAERELRTSRLQAARLIVEGLRRAGLLDDAAPVPPRGNALADVSPAEARRR